MEEKKHEVEHRFYRRCAELLCVPDTYKPFPYMFRTRWNNRTAGNGRYVGFGLIRLFGTTVHMSLYHPEKINRWFSSHQAALDHLEGITLRCAPFEPKEA